MKKFTLKKDSLIFKHNRDTKRIVESLRDPSIKVRLVKEIPENTPIEIFSDRGFQEKKESIDDFKNKLSKQIITTPRKQLRGIDIYDVDTQEVDRDKDIDRKKKSKKPKSKRCRCK